MNALEWNPLSMIKLSVAFKITVHISSRYIYQSFNPRGQLTDAHCVRQHQGSSLRDPLASVRVEINDHHHEMTSTAAALFSSVEIQPSNTIIVIHHHQQQRSQHTAFISSSAFISPSGSSRYTSVSTTRGNSQPARASTQNTAHPLLQNISHS